MIADEETTLRALYEQKEAFKSGYRTEWVDPYVCWLYRRIDEKVHETVDFINSLPQQTSSTWDEDTLDYIHSRRRIIAGYHQEAELCRLEERIYEQVEEDKVYVLKGAWCVSLPRLPLSLSLSAHQIFTVSV